MTAANRASQDVVPRANKAARIESTDPIGPLAMLQVNKGDTVKLSAYAYYEGDGSTDGLISESALLAALLSGYSGASGISEVSAQTQAALESGLDFPNNLVPKTNETNDDAPKAYINYMQFDAEMNLVTSGFKQISTAAQGMKEYVETTPLTIDQNGYVLVYVSNESDELNWVHFDDFAVTHSKTPIVQVDDYYPFGLTFNSFTRNYSEPVRYKFQEQETDEETGWIAFKWRNHDPTIGRFFNVDPLAEKYLYNSPYAFSENKVTAHRELEGLESFSIKLTSIDNEGLISKNKIVVDRNGGVSSNSGLKMTNYESTKHKDGSRTTFISFSATVETKGKGEAKRSTMDFTISIINKDNSTDIDGEAMNGTVSLAGTITTGEKVAEASIELGGEFAAPENDLTQYSEIVKTETPGSTTTNVESYDFLHMENKAEKNQHFSGTTIVRNKEREKVKEKINKKEQ